VDWNTLAKVGLLALTAPFWWPVVKLLYRAAWNAGAEDTGSVLDDGTERKQTYKNPRVWSDRGETWSQKRLINSQWDTGRKGSPKRGFRKRAG